MPYFLFRFHFQNHPEACVKCWTGGKFTVAIKKSWETVRGHSNYHDIKGLRPDNISIFVLKKEKKPQAYLTWEQRMPKLITGPQAAELLMTSS